MILPDSTNLDSQATKITSYFHNSNKQKVHNNAPGSKTIGDGQNIKIPIASNISKNMQRLAPSPKLDKEVPSKTFQGVKRQRKASVNQRQFNTIDKFLVNHK